MYPSWDNSIPRNLDDMLMSRADTVRDGPARMYRRAVSPCVRVGHVITFAQRCLAPGRDMSTWRLP